MTLYVSNGMEKDYDDRNQPSKPRRIIPQIIVPKKCEHKRGACPAPGLPKLNPYGVPWCDRTKQWYEEMAHTPQSRLFAETDWMALEEASIIFDCIWNRGQGMRIPSPNAMVQLMTELRRRVQCWGYNHYDRVQLRLNIPTPQLLDQKEEEVRQAAAEGINYLEMLNEMVAEQREVAGPDGS